MGSLANCYPVEESMPAAQEQYAAVHCGCSLSVRPFPEGELPLKAQI